MGLDAQACINSFQFSNPVAEHAEVGTNINKADRSLMPAQSVHEEAGQVDTCVTWRTMTLNPEIIQFYGLINPVIGFLFRIQVERTLVVEFTFSEQVRDFRLQVGFEYLPQSQQAGITPDGAVVFRE